MASAEPAGSGVFLKLRFCLYFSSAMDACDRCKRCKGCSRCGCDRCAFPHPLHPLHPPHLLHLIYQRGSRRPPPPPPPPRLPRSKPPPPPPPPPIGLGRASLTTSGRPSILNSFSSEIAFCASSSLAISTNPNPRARPVAMSRMMRALSTVPARLKSSVSSVSPV